MLTDKKEQHKGNSKLREHEVRDIRTKLKLYREGSPGGCPPRFLADFYNMTTEAIRKIERREVWGHLPDELALTPEQERAAGEASAKKAWELQQKLESVEVPYIAATPGLSMIENMEKGIEEETRKNKAIDTGTMLEELASPTERTTKML